MNYRFYAPMVLFLAATPAAAQPVNKEDVLGALRLSSALIECGLTEEGVEVGKSAASQMSQVGLTQQSAEVVEAFVVGKQTVETGEITCQEVIEHARRAGVME